MFAIAGQAQVSVLEEATRAELIDGHTSISLRVKNTTAVTLKAQIELTWLSSDGKIDGRIRREADLSPGESSISMPHPLPAKAEGLTERLAYEITPSSRNYTAFRPFGGRLSFVHIADYAFAFGVVTAGTPRLGQSFEVRALAAHPITGKPVRGVTVTSDKVSAVTGEDGVALLNVIRDGDDDETIDITGRLGDFTAEGASTPLANRKEEITAYTDKPIYQPGQTMHVRLLVIDGGGHAAEGRELLLRIENESRDLFHSAALKTSRFGIASSDWEIPPTVEDGKYSISLKTEDSDHYFLTSVNVRHYDLPSFRVTAASVRPFYLVGQKAEIEVRGDYLFGKPMPGGKVRIAAENDVEKTLAEGVLDNSGRFRATLDVAEDLNEHRQFEDHHLLAFVTDPATNRTEPKKFDVRVSREAIHIYATRTENDESGRRVYVTTYSPDGAPLRSTVEVANDAVVLGTGNTNRFGLTRIDLPAGGDEVEIRVITADGQRAKSDLKFEDSPADIWLRTNRALYRLGETVRCSIGAPHAANVLLVGMNEEDDVLFTKSVPVKNGRAEIEIPYEKRFGRMLSLGLASVGSRQTAYRRVYFPGPADLTVKATPVRATYRPGETATVQFETSGLAALGISVVDQSVLERAATDSAFGPRAWLHRGSYDGPNLGGVTEGDLLNLDPTKIDGELQLVAEILAPNYGMFFNSADDVLREMQGTFRAECGRELTPVVAALDRAYIDHLQFPRDDAAFTQTVGSSLAGLLDPWSRPFRTTFSIRGPWASVQFWSSGPDKILGTADDFEALSVDRKWFALEERLMRRALAGVKDYPATPDDFARLLHDSGVEFDRLRDPWGTAMRLKVAYVMRFRKIQILSAGPDRKFNTNDDFLVTEFTGSYFGASEDAIARVLNAAPVFPSTPEEVREVLAHAGVDLENLRDPWGHPYYLALREAARFADKIEIYTYAQYNSSPEERKSITPMKVTTRLVEIHSVGEDGVKGTYDDFVIAYFSRVLGTQTAAADAVVEGGTAPPATLAGKGTIAGVVKDPSGAVVPNAEVRLDDTYTTRTGSDGNFAFRSLPPGIHSLRCQGSGFQLHEVAQIPVADGHVTTLEIELSVGSVSETVEVQAEAQVLNTSSAQVIPGQAAALPGLSTPRVREYFPETLCWQPELVTDGAGRASLRFKLADSVTTWHVAALASTLDGRIAETSAEIRAFQPFAVDLDVPQVLTAGDEISLPVPVRNYLQQPQKVTVTAKLPAEFKMVEAVHQPGVVTASASSNAILTMRAEGMAAGAKLRVTAVGGSASDAIEKPVAIHPDGERRSAAIGAVLSNGQSIQVTVGGDGIAGSLQGELRIYPSLLARILESIEVLLQSPHGCAEQTISSTYPSLMLLEAMQESGVEDEKMRARALKYVNAGYQKLLKYQAPAGGFTYWGYGDPDVSVTAYALTFLKEAAAFVTLDEDRVASARKWLGQQKSSDREANVLRIAALIQSDDDTSSPFDRELGELARKAAEFGDPYELAEFALAAMDAKKPELAGPAIEQLSGMARDERGTAYWMLKANTPFHGWGRWGQVESTGLAVSALARWRAQGHGDEALSNLIERGALFLLRNTDVSGAWATSQSTVRALTALLDTWRHEDVAQGVDAEVSVNGSAAGRVSLAAGHTLQGPQVVDISRWLRPGENQISLGGLERRVLQVQAVAHWYEPWSAKRPPTDLSMKVAYSTLSAAIDDRIECHVTVSRETFRGFGMLIAEVGLPPGAAVDHGILQALVDGWKNGVDAYEVAPDHVTFYVWPQAEGVDFRFAFRPRYAMKARAAQSVLYDFYNPDDRVTIRPVQFVVGK